MTLKQEVQDYISFCENFVSSRPSFEQSWVMLAYLRFNQLLEIAKVYPSIQKIAEWEILKEENIWNKVFICKYQNDVIYFSFQDLISIEKDFYRNEIWSKKFNNEPVSISLGQKNFYLPVTFFGEVKK